MDQFLQNRDVCLNQEGLPITYHNFHHQSLVRPKSKFPKLTKISTYKLQGQFSQKESMHQIDIKFNLTYQNNQGVGIQVRPLLRS